MVWGGKMMDSLSGCPLWSSAALLSEEAAWYQNTETRPLVKNMDSNEQLIQKIQVSEQECMSNPGMVCHLAFFPCAWQIIFKVAFVPCPLVTMVFQWRDLESIKHTHTRSNRKDLAWAYNKGGGTAWPGEGQGLLDKHTHCTPNHIFPKAEHQALEGGCF